MQRRTRILKVAVPDDRTSLDHVSIARTIGITIPYAIGLARLKHALLVRWRLLTTKIPDHEKYRLRVDIQVLQELAYEHWRRDFQCHERSGPREPCVWCGQFLRLKRVRPSGQLDLRTWKSNRGGNGVEVLFHLNAMIVAELQLARYKAWFVKSHIQKYQSRYPELHPGYTGRMLS